MNPKKLLLVLGLFFICIQMSAQVKVLPNGKVGIGTMNPKYGALEIGKSGANNGIAIYDSLSTTPPFKIYKSDDFVYLNFEGVREKGFRIRKDGHIDLGVSPLTGGWEDLINVYINSLNPRSAFMADVNYPFDYGYVLKVLAKSADIVFLVKDRNFDGEHTFRLYGCVFRSIPVHRFR